MLAWWNSQEPIPGWALVQAQARRASARAGTERFPVLKSVLLAVAISWALVVADLVFRGLN